MSDWWREANPNLTPQATASNRSDVEKEPAEGNRLGFIAPPVFHFHTHPSSVEFENNLDK